ncbi:MAG: DNRLRE domain-containing protein [Lacibacter sp.]
MNNSARVLFYFISALFLVAGCKKEKPNNPPTADAGLPQNIQLPVNYTLLSGSGSDLDGSIINYSWVQTNGPTTAKIESPASAATKVSGLIAGVYSFKFSVKDNAAAIAEDTVSVTVIPGQNKIPVANAGIPQVIQLPDNYTYLAGSGKDDDGTISTYKWTQTSGPSTSTIESSGSAVTKISSLVAGVYRYQLMVTDNKGDAGVDSVSVTVLAAQNKVPVANAGVNQTIELPLNYVTVTGSGTDSDGSIKGYLWSQLSGPSVSVIENPAAAATKISSLAEGAYVFQFMVIDDKGATGLDTMSVFVKSASIKTLTLQPGADEGQDARVSFWHNCYSGVSSGVDYNLSYLEDLEMTAWTFNSDGCATGEYRSYLKFTGLSTIPQNATILSAKLSLYGVNNSIGSPQGNSYYPGSSYNSFGTNDCWIKRAVGNWDESTVTWNNQPGVTEVNRVAIPASTSQWGYSVTDIDVTEMVKPMVNTANSNFGFCIMLQVEQYYRSVNFGSSDNVDPAKRPKLIVTYK